MSDITEHPDPEAFMRAVQAAAGEVAAEVLTSIADRLDDIDTEPWCLADPACGQCARCVLRADGHIAAKVLRHVASRGGQSDADLIESQAADLSRLREERDALTEISGVEYCTVHDGIQIEGNSDDCDQADMNPDAECHMVALFHKSGRAS